MIRTVLPMFFCIVFSVPVAAEEFTVLSDRTTFLSVVKGKTLTRMGIRLDVLPDGQISGAAFGQSVTGRWTWADGFFCRDLSWGSRDLGGNCQIVKVDGETIRFVSDRGQGRFADLNLR